MINTEIYTITKLHRTYLICDKCKEKMFRTGVVFATYPELYQYKCPTCEETTSDTRRFPLYQLELDNGELIRI